jgi:hypothetical protein
MPSYPGAAKVSLTACGYLAVEFTVEESNKKRPDARQPQAWLFSSI